jgi:hypothetical protein
MHNIKIQPDLLASTGSCCIHCSYVLCRSGVSVRIQHRPGTQSRIHVHKEMT